jgi:hypothetical protein
MITGIKNTLSKLLCHISIDCNSDVSNTILLAGTGRSGTTWVSNIINYKHEYRYMFEPFNPLKVDICNNFKNRQYLRSDNQDKAYFEPARCILTGNIRNYWIDRYNYKIISVKRLIKDIRANLILKWLSANFSGLKIILLLRHPCAVANSKLKLNWGTHLDELLSQKELMEDFLSPFEKEIQNAQTLFEKHIFLWCIENYIPLKQFNAGKIHLAFYEYFCIEPYEEIRSLFHFLNKGLDKNILKILHKPSQVSRQGSAILSGSNLINEWRRHISDDQIRKAIKILEYFELDRIYSENSLPDITNASHFYNAIRI